MRDSPDPLPLIDSHAHLDFEAFQPDFTDVLERARQAGLTHIVTIGAGGGFDSNRGALEIAAEHHWISATLGIHPHAARIATDRHFEQLEALALEESTVVAVGETGLDYHYDYSPRDVQRSVFRRFVRLARQVGKPLVIHTREAESDTVNILRDEGAEAVGGIIHCFSGTAWLAQQALDLGFHLSFSGIVTYSWATEVQGVAGDAPVDRILVETDAPYLTPRPYKGRNEPAFVNQTLRRLAELRDADPEWLARQTTANAGRLLGIGDRP